MKARHLLGTLGAMSILLLAARMLHASDLSKAKCPVSGRAVAEEYAVSFAGGKVYLCSDNCLPMFSKNSPSYAVKAHHQLAMTGQAKQDNCPLTGKPIDPTKTVDIDGVSVGFCCEKCQDKISKETRDQQMQDCFNPEAFKNAFKVQ